MTVAAALVLTCYLFVERTKYGAIIRAGIEDRDMAAALGINIGRVFTVTYAAGAALAGLAEPSWSPCAACCP